MHQLVLLETSANQAYLFATNRLRENVGASELTWRAGTQWVLESVTDHGGPALWDPAPAKLRKRLRATPSANGIEVIIASSGKALLIVDDRAKAEAIVEDATRRALAEAPGLDLCGAIVPHDPVAQTVHEAIAAVHARFNDIRGLRPQPQERHFVLPVAWPCASSGLPAAEVHLYRRQDRRPLSRMSLCKHQAAKGWRQRLNSILANSRDDIRFPQDLDKLERQFEEMDWLGIVHADGNAMGKTFLEFDKHCGCEDSSRNNDYVIALREFSLALDEATEAAFIEACAVLPELESSSSGGDPRVRPIVPLVIGGDDLTALVHGRYALAFTREFLSAFERNTRTNPVLSCIASNSVTVPWFGACAGVAIVKPHFPFHSAYTLAEQLLQSAKAVKKRAAPFCSALDFHVLFDAAFTELDAIRTHLTVDGGQTALTAGPYVTTADDRLAGASSNLGGVEQRWVQEHDIAGLETRVRALNAREGGDGYLCIPTVQAHALREALFQGGEAADARLRQIRHRYPKLDALCENCTNDKETLFRIRSAGRPECETRFLDALTSASFWCDRRDGAVGARDA